MVHLPQNGTIGVEPWPDPFARMREVGLVLVRAGLLNHCLHPLARSFGDSGRCGALSLPPYFYKVCMHAYIYVYICIHTHIYIYNQSSSTISHVNIHIQICIHTSLRDIHIYIYIFVWQQHQVEDHFGWSKRSPARNTRNPGIGFGSSQRLRQSQLSFVQG